MNARRTDLALEAHALFRAAQKDDAIDGLTLTERTRRGCAVTTVTVESKAASRALGKPRGTYVTLDLRALSPEDPAYTERAALALRDELRALLEGTVDTALVVGLGNRAMTPDVIGPRAADHVPATRHLKGCAAFGALADVSVLTPGVLGTTGLEAAELVRGAVETVRPDLVVAVDALASQSLGRVCTTVQLTDAGIVPGSGVGNHRRALTRETLGVPVLAVGVPTVVDAATLALDLLDEAGADLPDPAALRGQGSVMVTPRDIDYSNGIVDFLGIKHYTFNIHGGTSGILGEMARLGIEASRQTTVNLPSRIRMATLYAIAQSVDAGIVVNTSNLSEDWVGYCTIYGDSAGAFSPIGMYTTEEVIAIGRALGLPERFLIKPPSDGLTGKTDEDNLGFSYHAVNEYVRKGVADPAIKEQIDHKHRVSRFKFETIPVYHNGLPIVIEDGTDFYK